MDATTRQIKRGDIYIYMILVQKIRVVYKVREGQL